MAGSGRSYRGLKICGCVTAILLITIAVVLVILMFTLFKPKQPKITSESVTLQHIRFLLSPPSLNFTLGIALKIENPNYGSFKYEESTTYVSYHGNIIGEAPIQPDYVPARGKYGLNISVTIFADKLLADKNFLTEFLITGILNFTSATNLHGKVSVFNLLKAKATTLTTCDISLLVKQQTAESSCKSKVSL